ncbi:MAG: response regulator transcription factor [Bacteroidia bacterium]|nr:response regulator transcription factor [Bacteroidia bacterium]
MKKTKILVADAQTLTREGIKAIFAKNSDIEVCGVAINSAELQKLTEEKIPDIVVIDYYVEGLFSIKDIEWLKKMDNPPAVLFISSNKTKVDVLKVMDYGVNCYLLKECDEQEIISAINACIKKENFFCGRVMDAILDNETENLKPVFGQCMPVSLSDREEEIVTLIAQGLTTKEIANKLNLSFFTVGTHRKNIFKKVKIRNSSQLINYAIKSGLITA